MQTFERESQRLQNELLVLTNEVERPIIEAVESLKQRDFEATERLSTQARMISQKRFAIEADWRWVAYNLERAANRVISICEWVVFAVTGGMAEMERA